MGTPLQYFIWEHHYNISYEHMYGNTTIIFHHYEHMYGNTTMNIMGTYEHMYGNTTIIFHMNICMGTPL